MKRVTTENTIWLFDEGKQCYLRMPRWHEGQDRSGYTWQGERLADNEWIPFTTIGWDPESRFRLNIHTPHPHNRFGIYTGTIVSGREDAEWLVKTYKPHTEGS